jgi:hypothetical protein
MSLAADDRTPDTPTLAVQVLGCRMNHQVGTKLKRSLQGRCTETIVYYQQTIVFSGQVGHNPYIRDLA